MNENSVGLEQVSWGNLCATTTKHRYQLFSSTPRNAWQGASRRSCGVQPGAPAADQREEGGHDEEVC